MPTPCSSVGHENRRSLVRSPARPEFLPRTDAIHYNRIHSLSIVSTMVMWEST